MLELQGPSYGVSIRYIAVLGFQPRGRNESEGHLPLVSIRYIAVLGFQLGESLILEICALQFQSAISRYLVSNTGTVGDHKSPRVVFQSAISRYLVSNQQSARGISPSGSRFQSAISRYLVSNKKFSSNNEDAIRLVSIRYIAVLGFQQSRSKKLKQR